MENIQKHTWSTIHSILFDILENVSLRRYVSNTVVHKNLKTFVKCCKQKNVWTFIFAGLKKYEIKQNWKLQLAHKNKNKLIIIIYLSDFNIKNYDVTSESTTFLWWRVDNFFLRRHIQLFWQFAQHHSLNFLWSLHTRVKYFSTFILYFSICYTSTLENKIQNAIKFTSSISIQFTFIKSAHAKISKSDLLSRR